jgi:hypothetical protein
MILMKELHFQKSLHKSQYSLRQKLIGYSNILILLQKYIIFYSLLAKPIKIIMNIIMKNNISIIAKLIISRKNVKFFINVKKVINLIRIMNFEIAKSYV